MKQNSTKNMMIRHLKDIKAKIERKSIHNMELPFEGPFKNKYSTFSAKTTKLEETIFFTIKMQRCYKYKIKII